MAALGMAAIMHARESANRLTCMARLAQIGLALHAYHDTYQVLPPGLRDESDPYPFLSWHARLLPFMEQENLWRDTQAAFAKTRLFLGLVHRPIALHFMPIYVCPSDPRLEPGVLIQPGILAPTSYLGLEGTSQYSHDGVLFLNSGVRFADVSDGLSSTLLVGERPPSADGVFGWWYAGFGQAKDGSADMVLGVLEENSGSFAPMCPLFPPYEFGPGSLGNQCDEFHFWSLHPGGANFLFCDGSVRFLSYSAAPIMPALATRRGGEAVQLPE
jgi:prepilin-type processing-associated H-X9-DG protein